MGSIYRRTKQVIDPASGEIARVEIGPYWIQFYRNGRAYSESTRTLSVKEAHKKLKRREGEVVEGRFRGVQVERTRYEDLVAGMLSDYRTNKRKTLTRLQEHIAHLNTVFKDFKAADISSGAIRRYVEKRQGEKAANGTINRELSTLKRMFSIAAKETPPKVGQVPQIPMLEERNIRSGFLEHEDFLALRGVLPDYAQVAVTLAYYSGMRMGEVLTLEWDQVNMADGKLFLRSEDTKTETPRVLYLTGDLHRVLTAWKQRCDEKWRDCTRICHYNGTALTSIRSAWQRGCVRVGLGRWVKQQDKRKWRGSIPHDMRRTAVRNMVRAGVPEKIAMAISGHKTRSVFDRYNIVNEADLKAAAERLSAYFSNQTATISATIGELTKKGTPPHGTQVLDSVVDSPAVAP